MRPSACDLEFGLSQVTERLDVPAANLEHRHNLIEIEKQSTKVDCEIGARVFAS